MNLFQWIFAPLCFLATAILIHAVVRGRFSFWKGGFWASIWLVGGLMILLPEMTSWVATRFGIGRGSDLILYLAVLTGCWLFQRLYSRTRNLENVVTELARQHAIQMAGFAGASSETSAVDQGFMVGTGEKASPSSAANSQ